MRVKKSASIIEVFMTVIIGTFVLGSMIVLLTTFAEDSGQTIPSHYEKQIGNLTSTQTELEDVSLDIKSSIGNVTEADNIAQVAWNGLKGMVAVFKIPLKVVDLGSRALSIGYSFLDSVPIPKTAFVALSLAISVILIFAVLRFVSQRGNDA